MIQAIIFDMDGVLIDSEKVYVQQIKKALRKRNLDDSDEFVHSFVGTCDKDMLPILDEYLAPHTTGQEFLDEMYEGQGTIQVDFKSIMMPGLYETLDYFKQKEYKLALASSSPRETINKVLKALDIEDVFDEITSGYEFKQSKPHPEIYTVTLEKLGIKAEEAIAIEDSNYGITSSKEANIYTVALKDQSFGIDQSEADVIVDTLMDTIQIAQKRGGK